MELAVVWFRRDLRVADNPALCHALRRASRIIPVYIHAPDEEAPWQPGAASCWWLHHSLLSLDRSLRELGSGLVIRKGASAQVLAELVGTTAAELVCWNRLHDPVVRSRDDHVADTLSADGVQVRDFGGYLLREPDEVLKSDGTPFRVFTPFHRSHRNLGPPGTPMEGPKSLPRLPLGVSSLSVEELNLVSPIPWHDRFGEFWQPGETGARSRLRRFLYSGVSSEYARTRDLPGLDGVSGLSPHLHFGEISVREVWHSVSDAMEGVLHAFGCHDEESGQSYLRQLVWRDFAHHVLTAHPHTPMEPFNGRYLSFSWEERPELLVAWQQGRTGIPLVDAGMRQLWQTGWMHNRVRMIVATVLSKHGLVHWLEGARWFWDTLVDANLANNTLGWQWTAGCGVDAVPYFRILSPVRQGERFDPRGEYVRRWVPELAGLPDRYVHQPWRTPSGELARTGLVLDENYPRPVLDLGQSRREALRRYRVLADAIG